MEKVHKKWLAVYFRPTTNSIIRVPVRDYDEYTKDDQQEFEAACVAESEKPNGFILAEIELRT